MVFSFTSHYVIAIIFIFLVCFYWTLLSSTCIGCSIITHYIAIYIISDNFRDKLIFAFFTISFKIEYAEIISLSVSIGNILNRKIKTVIDFLQFQLFDTEEKQVSGGFLHSYFFLLNLSKSRFDFSVKVVTIFLLYCITHRI